MITFKDQQMSKKISAMECIESPVTKQVVAEMVRDAMKGSGWEGDNQMDFSISDWKPGCFNDTMWISGDKYYDWLMDQPETTISDNISARIQKKMIFVSHDYSEFTLAIVVTCDLPEDDFKTLDMLGKVHREFKPGKMEQSIFCEI